MERRTFFKTAGGVGAAAALGGASLLASTGTAAATAGGSISDPSQVTSDDGRIKWVAVQTTGRMTWDGFDTAAKYGQIVIDVELKRDGSVIWSGQIHDTGFIDFSQGSGWGGSGEEIILTGDNEPGQSGHIASDTDWGIVQRNRDNIYNSGYPLPNNPAPASYLEASTDGGQTKTRVVLKAEYRLFDANKNELTGSSGYPGRPTFSSDFVVTVNNQEATTGSGDADAEGDTDDSATVGV